MGSHKGHKGAEAKPDELSSASRAKARRVDRPGLFVSFVCLVRTKFCLRSRTARPERNPSAASGRIAGTDGDTHFFAKSYVSPFSP